MAANWEEEWVRRVEKSSGKTVDGLIAAANGDEIELLFSIEIALQQKAEKHGEQALSSEERLYLAIEALEREVNNGGYSQFFLNSSRAFAPIIVESLRQIDCSKNAEIAARAINALGPASSEPDAIMKAVESYAEEEQKRWEPKAGGAVFHRKDPDAGNPSLHDSITEELDECDRLYYSAGENIGGQLIEFVKANKSRIQP